MNHTVGNDDIAEFLFGFLFFLALSYGNELTNVLGCNLLHSEVPNHNSDTKNATITNLVIASLLQHALLRSAVAVG